MAPEEVGDDANREIGGPGVGPGLQGGLGFAAQEVDGG